MLLQTLDEPMWWLSVFAALVTQFRVAHKELDWLMSLIGRWSLGPSQDNAAGVRNIR